MTWLNKDTPFNNKPLFRRIFITFIGGEERIIFQVVHMHASKIVRNPLVFAGDQRTPTQTSKVG